MLNLLTNFVAKSENYAPNRMSLFTSRHKSTTESNYTDIESQLKHCYALMSDFTFNFSLETLQTALNQILISELQILDYALVLRTENGHSHLISNNTRFSSTQNDFSARKFSSHTPIFVESILVSTLFGIDQSDTELYSNKSLIVPLRFQDQEIGVLFLTKSKQKSFLKSDQYFFNVFGSHLAAIIKNLLAFQEIRKQSITDSLTQIPNRRQFIERYDNEVERASRYSRPLSVLMIDIDYFKNYNDKFGHLAGDKVLKEIAKVLKDEIRIEDFLARFGGEEFVAILPETDRSQAFKVAEKLRILVETQFKDQSLDDSGKITISIGFSSFPSEIKNPENLLKEADAHLFEAKKNGRNLVFPQI